MEAREASRKHHGGMLFGIQKPFKKTKQQTVSAMFIIKFNKMIRNKWIWGAFATIVALSFAFSDLFSGGGGRGRNDVGTLGGKPVEMDEYSMARQAVLVENRGGAESGVAGTERDIWLRLATLAAAEKAGVEIPDATVGGEIVNSIRNVAGAFDTPTYHNIIRGMGFRSPQMYEEVVRRQIAAGVMERAVSAAAFLPPAIVESRLKGLTDTFTIRTATLTNSHSEATVDLTDEDARKYFNANSENWREPERRAVVYAEFAAADFVSEVSIPEDEIIDYYDANIQMFSVVGTNGVEAARPLEDVRKEIEDKLAVSASKDAALRRAGDFADVFYDSRDPDITFEAAAAAFGATVVTSQQFAANGSPVRASSSPAFVEAAFRLQPEGAERFSDAVDGGDSSFVIGWLSKTDSHIPDFEALKAKVLPRAKSAKVMELFRADTDAIAKAFTLGKDAGTGFADVAAAQGLALSTNFTISYMASFGSGIPGANEIALALPRMKIGDFSSSPAVADDAAVFFELNGREAGGAHIRASFKQRVVADFQQNLSKILLDDWREKNLLAMEPRPRIPFATAESADYDEEAGDY